MEQRVELHVHTASSEEASVISPAELIETAVAYGHPAVAVTCLNSVQDFPALETFWQRCGRKIKVIYGAQVCCHRDGALQPVVLLAGNGAGLKGLYQILSSVYQRENRAVDGQLIAQYRKDLLLGCPTWLTADGNISDDSLRSYDYIAITPQQTGAEQARQWALYTKARALQIPMVAVGNCHCLKEADRIAKEVIDRGEVSPGAENSYFRTTEEMLAAFSYLGEDVAWETVVTNPGRIADRVERVYPTMGDFPPFTLPEGEKTVARLCRQRLETLYGKQPPAQIRARLDQELQLLGSGANEYLVCHRLIGHLRKKGAITGSRGTVGSTLVAWLLAFSDVNPLPAHYRCPGCRYTEFADGDSGFDLPEKACPHCGKTMHRDGCDIPFEVALGVCGNDPLIDLAVPVAMYPEAPRFLAEELGKDRVALAGGVRCYSRKQAEEMARDYIHKSGRQLPEATFDRAVTLLSKMKKQDGLLPMVRRPEWEQAYGVVLLPQELEWEDLTPLRPVKNSPIGQATHMEYYWLEHALPKIDVLHYSVYDRVQRLFEVAGVKPEDVDYCDPEVYRLFQALDTKGLPEFDSDFCRAILARLDKVGFGELVKVSGLAHSTGAWRDNGEHLLGVHDFRALIGSRDDVFRLLRDRGLDRETAYSVMSAVRKGRFNREKAMKEVLEKAGVPDWYISSMEKIGYLCPKAHAAHYVRLAVCCAWFKVHYPEAFSQVMLNGQ